MQSAYDSRDAVIRAIEAAFDGVSRHGGVSLHEADVIDNYGTPAEREDARALDTETRWQDVAAGDIRTYYWILPFLDPIGYRYYLPAYMSWSLRNHAGPRDATSAEFTVFSLVKSEAKREEWELDRFKMFNVQQARAIRRFLEYMAEHAGLEKDAGEALARYWEKFGDASE